MLEKRGKMIVYKCDACKEEIPPHEDSKLMIWNSRTRKTWDICPKCLPTLTQLYGEGRFNTPSASGFK